MLNLNNFLAVSQQYFVAPQLVAEAPVAPASFSIDEVKILSRFESFVTAGAMAVIMLGTFSVFIGA